MSTNVTVTVHPIAEDGLPDMDDKAKDLTGRVAFIWNGSIVSGWPITADYDDDFDPDEQKWEPGEDRHGGPVIGVTHWVEFPEPVWNLERK